MEAEEAAEAEPLVVNDVEEEEEGGGREREGVTGSICGGGGSAEEEGPGVGLVEYCVWFWLVLEYVWTGFILSRELSGSGSREVEEGGGAARGREGKTESSFSSKSIVGSEKQKTDLKFIKSLQTREMLITRCLSGQLQFKMAATAIFTATSGETCWPSEDVQRMTPATTTFT